MSEQTFAKNPPVFSFQRAMLLSDGAFFNLIDGSFQEHPLAVVRHGIRGTQNVNEKEDKGDSAKEGGRDVSNIQQTESAMTHHDAEGVVVTFGLRMLDLSNALFACAAEDVETTNAVRSSVTDFIERAKASNGLIEVSRRLARNIANGSWLWRNRVVASEVTVDVYQGKDKLVTFDAFAIPKNTFGNYTESEIKLASVLADGLRGDRQASIEVRATLRFGVKGSIEVFPSQAYIEDKPKGFARPLYKVASALLAKEKEDRTAGMRVMGQAGLRDQKISNRLRTIDTWYAGYDEIGVPIPVEPNGASLDFMQFFRSDKKNASAFGMFARLNNIKPDTNEGMFTIASLIRGGVYGEKAVAPKKDKKGAAEALVVSDEVA